MSGHSKWSKVKHQKESTDAAKGKIFTKMAGSIIIAVKEGGGMTDPASNFRLRLAIEKARSANMPKENIERAIEKGKGHIGEGGLERVVYEAIGPGKIGIIIEAATDNHQRTTAEVKNILDRGGGVLAAQGAFSYLFKYLGEIIIPKGTKSFDDLMSRLLEIGGEDLEEGEGKYKIYTLAGDLHKVKEVLEKDGLQILSAELIYKPILNMNLTEEENKKARELIRKLEESADVLKVYSNLSL